ncbi:MAG: hypothetical protein JWN95_1359 [Frankiales bacterium]|nr:hypothetical protein [Frankiales bacterium]
MGLPAKAAAGAMAAVMGVMLVVVVLLGHGDDATAGTCGVSVTAPTAAASTTPVVALSSLDAEAQTNARAVAAVVLARKLPQVALVIVEMTAVTESGLHNVGFGDQAGPDSRGIFQQRDSWGPLSVRMDPAGAAGLFLDRMVNVAGWQTQPAWVTAQDVQVSSYDGAPSVLNNGSSVVGGNYKANYATGVALAAALYSAPGAALSCGSPTASDATGPVPVAIAQLPVAPAPYTGPADGGPCDVADGGGCLREVTAHGREEALTALGDEVRSVSCYGNRDGDHGTGVACDFMITTGAAAAGQDLTNGWLVAAWFRANAAALHVAYLIWQVRIWDARHPQPDDSAGWGQPYMGCSYCPPLAGDPSASHTNHVHVSFQSPVTE